MNASDPMAQLKDIHTPEAIGWWPLAPLWWVIIALALILLATVIVLLMQRYRRNQYRRTALLELHKLPADEDNQTFALQLNTLLKRTAISAYGENACATLHGEKWLAFLRTSAPKLNAENARPLADAAYQANPSLDQAALRAYAASWIKHHQKKSALIRRGKHV
ncbi:DUF4381 domain-containing protein [Gilvimarinus sp. DA14]|uniref:DUF4381 domain-containing protein n=1 Tax=Gilvimarinus sp. DA14 TaxID=2956798 RepID=UPI0020B79F8E|nr:DUF4381 domain-containing protein [Gilvimarinus sp. DA14]UTF60469.1 DUF4381 domain-containing protein [Gilvimarinus sp. DA14]